MFFVNFSTSHNPSDIFVSLPYVFDLWRPEYLRTLFSEIFVPFDPDDYCLVSFYSCLVFGEIWWKFRNLNWGVTLLQCLSAK